MKYAATSLEYWPSRSKASCRDFSRLNILLGEEPAPEETIERVLISMPYQLSMGKSIYYCH